MATAAERQRAYKQKMAEAGFIQVNVWVRPSQASKLKLLADAMRATPDLEPGPAIDGATRRFVKYD